MKTLFAKYGIVVNLVKEDIPPVIQFKEFQVVEGVLTLKHSIKIQKEYGDNFYWDCFHNGNGRIIFISKKGHKYFDFCIRDNNRDEIRQDVLDLIEVLNKL